MHETTTVAEMKRLYGSRIEEAIKVDAPGIKIGTQPKYGVDFRSRPEKSLMRPEAVEQMRRNQALNKLADACIAGFSVGLPLASFVSENPSRSFRPPRLTMIFYEAGHFHRHPANRN